MRPLRRLVRLEPKSLRKENTALDSRMLAWQGRLPGKGWYMLEFQLAEGSDAQHLLLHVDCGGGVDPALAVTLPLRRGKVAKRICYFPARVKSLELEIVPVGSAAESESGLPGAEGSEVSHCCLAWLAPYFARDRLCQRLANMHRNFRSQTRRDVRLALKREAAAKGRSWHSLALLHYGETFHKRCPDAGYSEWLAQLEAEQILSAAEASEILAGLTSAPEFLLRIRLSGQAADGAWQAARSLIAQSYPHWRLVVEVGPSLRAGNHPVVEYFNDAAENDVRVSVLEASNSLTSVLAPIPAGCFVSELPASGRLDPHALLLAAQKIAQAPESELLYTDADSLNRAGGREAPLFKPAWNPDLLLAYNYVGQFCFFRDDLLQRLGCGFPAAESVSNYHSLLRCRHELSAAQVAHLPRVLYHQKYLLAADQEALCAEERNTVTAYLQTEISGRPAVLEFRQHPDVPGTAIACYRWSLPQPAPLVSLLVPTRDGVEILRQCVDSILHKTEYPNFEILILDNQSSCPQTLAYLAQMQSDARVQVHRWDHPFNYSSINNFGASLARGAILGLINNDIEVITPGWLCEMVSHACREEIGCVGAKLFYGNDTLQHGGVILGIGGTAGHSHKYAPRDAAGYMGRLQAVQNLSAVTGACLLLRKTVFDEVGGLEEEHLPVAYNDVDLCLKVREAGYRNLWTPHAELYHHESVSRGADDTAAKRRRAQREADYMRRRWGAQLDCDPAYNPNLTLIFEDFSLA